MKKQLLFLGMLISIWAMGNAQINFPDPNFKNALLNYTPAIDTNDDDEISIEEAEAVLTLRIDEKNISDLSGIQNFINLQYLYAQNNPLSAVDVASNPYLLHLNLSNTGLTSIDVSANIEITDLTLDFNEITTIELTNNTALEHLSLERNNLSAIDVGNNTALKGLDLRNNQLTTIDVSKNRALYYLSLNRNSLTAVDVTTNTELELLDLVSNRLTSIDVTNNTKLTRLNLRSNSISELDVTNNVNLVTLDLNGNYELRAIDVTNALNLVNLNLNRNDLDQIDVSNNTQLTKLGLGSNNLRQIDLTNNPNLTDLIIHSNQLTQVNLTNNPELTYLSIGTNELTEIDLSNQGKLEQLYMGGTKVSTLDVRASTLRAFTFHQSPNLKTVFMTGQNPTPFRTALHTCPALEFICADEVHIEYINGLLEEADQTDCMLSSNCDDNPYNVIQGTVTYDINNDGCDATDGAFTGGIRISAISLTNGTAIIAYPNEEGNYTIHAPDDTYFFGPALQNPGYYTFATPIFPAPTNLPSGLASLTTDYCVQPVGMFNDLEVTIVPLDAAIPGFEASYQITYTNIGTTTQSGSVTLDYPEATVDYISSTPTNSSNTDGQLAWDFTDLAPMDSATILVTFILNTPTDATNPLNSGDTLNYTATVTAGTDETPDNNVMELVQEVVNSYDPNDKTCLEGTTLDPDDVGKYLHYLIRFENEGTANARNIRVTDVIDTTKLDIESFVPLKSSHSYSTMITNKNEIEFTFSNINLPFDDANNDGYVVFKIKSKDDLVLGDTIVNSAAIYFDFNFPIITEDEIVTVAREVATEPEFSDYFTLSPNPTTGILNLTVLDTTIKINNILIYDIGGNLVGFYLGNTRVMNVAYLFPNSYIMKINTDKGEFATQFIKL